MPFRKCPSLIFTQRNNMFKSYFSGLDYETAKLIIKVCLNMLNSTCFLQNYPRKSTKSHTCSTFVHYQNKLITFFCVFFSLAAISRLVSVVRLSSLFDLKKQILFKIQNFGIVLCCIHSIPNTRGLKLRN